MMRFCAAGVATMPESITRRAALRVGVAGIAIGSLGNSRSFAEPPRPSGLKPPRAFLTLGKDFQDVSRGDPIPHTLTGDALIRARLTPETWRLEVVAEDKAEIQKPLRIADGNSL